MRRLLDEYGSWLYSRGRAESTVKMYTYIASRFLDWMYKMGYRDMNTDRVLEFLGHVRESGGSPTYIRLVFRSLKSLFRFMGIPWDLTRDDIPPDDEPHIPYFTLEEMERLIEVAKNYPVRGRGGLEDPEERRACIYAMVRLAVTTGIRRKELCNLNVEDYRPPYLIVRTTKHGRQSIRLLDDETIEAIERYLALRSRRMRIRESDPLFCSGKRRRYSPEHVSRIFSRIRRLAGIDKKGASVHAIRRGLCTELHKRGMSETMLMEYFGWKTPVVVSRYIRLTKEDVEKAVRRSHPFLGKR